MHTAAIRLLRMLRKEDAAAGISGPQLSALSVLVFAGPQTLTSLAAAEQLSMPTMSRLVTELERRGLASRTAMPRDRRTLAVAVTDEGRALMLRGRAMRLAKLTNALQRLPADDQTVLARAAGLILSLNEEVEG